jgi:hypothetical protein
MNFCTPMRQKIFTPYDRKLFVLSSYISFIYGKQHLMELQTASSSRDAKNGVKLAGNFELQKRIADYWRHKSKKQAECTLDNFIGNTPI